MFKNKLDDLKYYRGLDTHNIYENYLKSPQQFEQNWHQGQFLNLLVDPGKIKHIFFCGTGYSSQVGKLLTSLSPLLFDVPFEIIESYRLPKYADKNSLLIVSSFLGSDLQSISVYQEALAKKCPTIVITSGGKIRDLAVENHTPLIILEDKSVNPQTDSSSIFAALGAVLGILTRLSPSSNQFFHSPSLVQTLEKTVDQYRREIDTVDNPAKLLAQKHKGLGVLFMGSAHLYGVCQVASHYLIQSSKTYSSFFTQLELTSYPGELKNQNQFILLNSNLYPKQTQEIFDNAKEKLHSQKYRLTVIKPDATEIVNQTLETLVFLIFFSYYLSIVNQTNPS